jgi:hypothetical protein
MLKEVLNRLKGIKLEPPDPETVMREIAWINGSVACVRGLGGHKYRPPGRTDKELAAQANEFVRNVANAHLLNRCFETVLRHHGLMDEAVALCERLKGLMDKAMGGTSPAPKGKALRDLDRAVSALRALRESEENLRAAVSGEKAANDE